MKNLLIIDPANFLGGAEKFMIDLINANTFKNFNVYLLTNNNKDYLNQINNKNINIIKMDLQNLPFKNVLNIFKFIIYVYRISKIIKEKKIDIIITNLVRTHFLGAILSKINKKDIYWFLHDFTFPKKLLNLTINIPKKIFVVSTSIKKYLIKNTKIKDRKNIITIFNAIDKENIKILKNKKSDISLPKKRKTDYWVAIIGRIEQWKGQEEFIQTAKILLKKYKNIKFFIAGETANNKEAQNYYNKLLKTIINISKTNIITTGYIKNIFPFIKKMDCIVNLSQEPEPFGRTIIEAMLMKKNIIATNLGGPNDIIKNNKTGFLITPTPKNLANKLEIYIENKNLREKHIKEAYISIQKKFNIQSLKNTIIKNI